MNKLGWYERYPGTFYAPQKDMELYQEIQKQDPVEVRARWEEHLRQLDT